MIAYFDTSALVKLLIEEPGSSTAAQTWRAADVRMCVTVGLTEAAAALGRASRMGRIDEATSHELLVELHRLWRGVTRLNADALLARDAATFAVLHGLRGYDAVHLAAAHTAGAVLVAADTPLLRAATEVGLATADVGR